MKRIVMIVLATLLVGELCAQHVASNKQHEPEIFVFPQRSFPNKVPRILNDVPAQHFPRPGECRIWYPDRVLGEQPPPMNCQALVGIMLHEGAFILLHNGKAYDAEYDWKKDRNKEREKEKSGKVPQVILDILFGPEKQI
jgi:hypothetical protein